MEHEGTSPSTSTSWRTINLKRRGSKIKKTTLIPISLEIVVSVVFFILLLRLHISMYKISVVWKHFKYKTININANNTLDINDIIAMETKVVSLSVTQDIIYDRVAA